MKRILWSGLLVLLLAACGTNQPDLPQATNTFNFNVDPSAQSVEFAATPATGLTAQAEDGSRVLVPGTDLSLEKYTFAFLPGNILAIDASFKNVSGKTLTNLTFTRVPGSSNIVSSAEPDVVETLEPGESTGILRFTVQHKGQRFIYEVEATAIVAEPSEGDCVNPVNIPDAVLRENLRDALNKPQGNITCADLQSLTRLFVTGISSPGGDEILDYASDLEGLQYATSLTFLLLASDNFPTGRLSPIADLENLTTLRLFSVINSNPDLTVLSGLTNLTEFSLSTRPGGSEYNGPLELDNLDVFSSLTKLTDLRLGDVAVSDISPLSNLTNLITLNIRNSEGDGRISDIEPLASLTKLEALTLTSNQIRDIQPVSGLTNLNYLELVGNIIRDLTPLVRNEQLGSGDSFIELYGNCLNENEEVNARARDDVDTIESRNPSLNNVYVDLNDKDNDNFLCDN